jgi:hypothetical protein
MELIYPYVGQYDGPYTTYDTKMYNYMYWVECPVLSIECSEMVNGLIKRVMRGCLLWVDMVEFRATFDCTRFKCNVLENARTRLSCASRANLNVIQCSIKEK